MDATSTQNYIELLEKTNQQLSLWYNPYGLMVGFLSLLVTLLAIYFAYILWRQSRDYKDFLLEQKGIIEKQTQGHAKVVLDEYISSRDVELTTSTGEAREKIEKELNNLRQARESLNTNTYPLGYTSRPSFQYRAGGGGGGSYGALTEAQRQSIISLLQSFGAEEHTIQDVEKALSS